MDPPYRQILRNEKVLFNTIPHSSKEVLDFLSTATPPTAAEVTAFGRSILRDVVLTVSGGTLRSSVVVA